MPLIREPSVAGHFYPGDPAELSRTLRGLLRDAPHTAGPPPKALIVPHAGYVYSGPVAATAYARLLPYRDQYSRVVLVGPSHRVPINGIALSACDAFRTPVGDVPLDKSAIESLRMPGVMVFESTHEEEHSLEVHLPFLQAVLGVFTLVPVLVGNATPEAVARVLDRVWSGPETLIVVSSDLSHYLSYEEARVVDMATCKAIERLDLRSIRPQNACGATPIKGLLLAARRHGLTVQTLDVRNSGDTASDRYCVVGYGAWMLGE